MASKHILDGLIKWSRRDGWAERFDQILADHLTAACEETGLEIDDIVEIIGEDLFTSTVWACAFEDFLTREFNGENAIDDYLKRRGWKESASTRIYMAALRNSTMSLHEVSDVVPGISFRARDLLRGGEPVLISERSATRSLKQWERIAARVLRVGSKMQIGGGVLAFGHVTAEDFIEALRRFGALGEDEKRQLANAHGGEFDDGVFSDLPTERLPELSPMLTTSWLVDAIDRIRAPRPEFRNADGDEIVACEVRYRLAAGTKAADVRAALKGSPEFPQTKATSWNWITHERPAAASRAGKPSQRLLIFETWNEDGALVLGSIALKNRALMLSVNSRQRSERGQALLSEIFGPRVGQPSVREESVEEVMASRDAAEPQKLDIPEEQRCAIIHYEMDRHYRRVLDEPVSSLGGVTPRAAVKTESGRVKVVQWLKMMENQTAKSGESNSAMASYDFNWLWTELGLSELRR